MRECLATAVLFQPPGSGFVIVAADGGLICCRVHATQFVDPHAGEGQGGNGRTQRRVQQFLPLSVGDHEPNVQGLSCNSDGARYDGEGREFRWCG